MKTPRHSASSHAKTPLDSARAQAGRARLAYFGAVLLELAVDFALLCLLIRAEGSRLGYLSGIGVLFLIGALVHWSPIGRFTDACERRRQETAATLWRHRQDAFERRRPGP
jgi:hypothetical protein